MKRSPCLIAVFLLVSASQVCAEEAITDEQLTFFETKIRPVLIRECYGCHSKQSGNARGGLTLDTKELMAIGGTTGPAVVPGNLEESWLYQAISYQDFEMPPKKKLPQSVIEDFKRWIEMGAPDPRSNSVEKIDSEITQDQISEAKGTFWAYRHPAKPELPKVQQIDWPKTDVDLFVLSRLEEAGMSPAEDAEAYKVLRRLTFDLVGLPPTRDQIEYFDRIWGQDPDAAVSHVVDRLLESSHYGERWGRHWMDVARYGESSGRGVNMTYPQAWRYRDYIINAFNDDKPYDRFVQEQLAGDLLPVSSDEEWASNLVATTFLAIGSKNVNESNRVQFAADLVDEQIDATTRVFLGTSVACARCHDHKFDPIPQSDYYALAGIFQSTQTYFGNPQSELGNFSGATEKQTSTLLILPIDDPVPGAASYSPDEIEAIKAKMAEARSEMIASRRSGSQGGAVSQRQRAMFNNRMADWSAAIASVDNEGQPKSFCMGVQDKETVTDARLLVRGEIAEPAQVVGRGFPQILAEHQPTIPSNSSGRLELAKWIGSDQNPLTARVMVNRVWLHLIGRGIVNSTENFGLSGMMPTHPELLDYLSLRFIESGWSIKALIKEIATSRVYRIASTFDQTRHEYDPDNNLLWRANPRRLDAEAIRDAMLSVSGELNTNRPVASVVAQSGYTRVQNGRLIPKMSSMINAARSPAGVESRDGVMRGGRRPGMARGGQGGFRPQRGPFGMMRGGAQASNPLDAEDSKYRSVYLPLVRDAEPRALKVFDFTDASTITGQRERSNSANQSLYMMNNPFVQQQSEAFARRLEEPRNDLSKQIDEAVLLAFSRLPTAQEKELLLQFTKNFTETTESVERVVSMPVICQSLFASAEFRFID